MVCVKCSSQVPETSRFCLSCGSALSAASGLATEAVSAVAETLHKSSPSESGDEGRFLPGSVLAERYRIISLLGRGGMGEVYRASDLKLNQQVALKFLPETLSKDEKALARFYNEVRIARQISHPHVCRVYDLGEVNGLAYISMEFINGEDLNSLLRRIGRLPAGKATDMARQLCAGLAAAHEKGVLHRDLKPANVMLDENGALRVMDFGLAGVAHQIADIRSGTPAYMAPEQLAGTEVSTRSDVYSLGLVLYEIFTGKRPFNAATLDELKQRQLETSPDSMSSQVMDLDPAVERVIMRCLAHDPKERPQSVRAVLGALPGADPLSAALAAGETPSPELVAAASQGSGMLPVPFLAACLAVLVASIAAIAWLSPRMTFFGLSKPELSAQQLAGRASEFVRRAGYPQKPQDFAYGLNLDLDYQAFRERTAGKDVRWRNLDKQQPGPLFFWYRESPRYLVAFTVATQGVVGLGDPFPNLSGMLNVQMDLKGRLTAFEAVAPQFDSSTGTPAAPPPVDWAQFFTAAGLDLKTFVAAAPKWTPLTATDSRLAWDGAFPDDPAVKVRVEAASFLGKPVYFDVIGPWTRAFRMTRRESQAGQELVQTAGIAVFFILVAAVFFFARYNLKHGRGDRKGAFRLAMFCILAYLAIQLIGGHHVPAREELALLQVSSYTALFIGAVVWLFYLALEPPVRRRWPQTLVSWSRVLSGSFRDPLVHGHVLVGLATGAFLTAIGYVAHLFSLQNGDAPAVTDLTTVLGLRFALGVLLANAINAAAYSLINFFFLFLFKLIFRKDWIAGGVFVVLFAIGSALTPNQTWLVSVVIGIKLCAILFILFRYGLLALAMSTVMGELAKRFFLTFEFGEWYGGPALLAMLVAVGTGVIAFHYALGSRKLLSDKLLDV